MVLQRAGIVQAAQARPEWPQFDHVDRGRTHGQTLEVVQRDAGKVRHDQFDHIAVRKSDDGVFGMLGHDLLDRAYGAALRLAERFAARETEKRSAQPARSSIPSCWTGPSGFALASRRISLRPDRLLCECAGCALSPAAVPFPACVPAGWNRSRRSRWRLTARAIPPLASGPDRSNAHPAATRPVSCRPSRCGRGESK